MPPAMFNAHFERIDVCRMRAPCVARPGRLDSVFVVEYECERDRARPKKGDWPRASFRCGGGSVEFIEERL